MALIIVDITDASYRFHCFVTQKQERYIRVLRVYTSPVVTHVEPRAVRN